MAEILNRQRQRLERLHQRWVRRWNTIAADSFSRVAEAGLGTSDTGHTWQAYTGTAYVIEEGKARLEVTGSPSTQGHTDVFTGKADVKLRVFWTKGATGAPPPSPTVTGLSFRSLGDGSYLRAGWDSGTTWRVQSVTAAGVVTTISSNTSGPSVTTGARYKLEVVLSGTSITLYVDGTSVIATTSATNQTAQRHGLFIGDASAHTLDNFRCLRN